MPLRACRCQLAPACLPLTPSPRRLPSRRSSPPNTLFRFKELKEPGTWEAPGGVFPQQRLIVVTATYQPPRKGVGESESQGGKMCAPALDLTCPSCLRSLSNGAE